MVLILVWLFLVGSHTRQAAVNTPHTPSGKPWGLLSASGAQGQESAWAGRSKPGPGAPANPGP